MNIQNILFEITEAMKIQVAEEKKSTPLAALQEQEYYHRTCYDFSHAMRTRSGVIAEFKRKSPSKGIIYAKEDVVTVTTGYEQAGASAVSILTNGPYFGGTARYIREARPHLTIPILRKEFIIDPYQIHEAKVMGADLILLIAECLSKEEIADYTDLAHSLDLQVLLELHEEKQLPKIYHGVDAVGINNRNLKTFAVDIDQSIVLSHKLPASLIKVAESGLSDPQDARRMRTAGFEGFLVGEQFMKQAHPAEECKRFIKSLIL